MEKQAEPLSPQAGGEMCCLFQINQNAAEDFNLTSDGEFNAIKSLVLGKVHGKETGSGFLINTLANRWGLFRTLLSESWSYLLRLRSC